MAPVWQGVPPTAGVAGLAYGHFGDGCVHVRIDFPMERDGQLMRRFLERAAALAARHGGSLSGEHGDGRARSELLPAMYGPDALRAMAQFKTLFDPDDIMNPGIVVRPAALDADLRRPQALPFVRPRRIHVRARLRKCHQGSTSLCRSR